MNELTRIIEKETSKYLNESIALIGSSKVFKEVLEKAIVYADCDESVLIYGETGTGKTALARAIHFLSPRREFPFVNFDCGLLSDSMSEGELFGHKKGAFTGAIENRVGLLESANKGTFLIDEIGNLSLNLQVKFLRVIQVKRIRSVGDNKEIKIDVRIICATNKNLKKGEKEGWFREDLFSRLNVLEIEIPPLRERKDDIFELVDYRLFKLKKKYGQKKKLSPEVYDHLLAYSWPGNVRELNNAIIKAYFNSNNSSTINVELFPDEIKTSSFKRDVVVENSNSRMKNIFEQLVKGEKDFWKDIHKPFMNRDLNRQELKELIKIGLQSNNRKYKSLCKKFKGIYPNGICLPGIQKFLVSPDGKFYICEKIGNSFPIGDVYNGFDVDAIFSLIDEYIRISEPVCLNCWAVRFCKACFVRAMKGKKLDSERKKEHCWEIKSSILSGLKSYCKVIKKNPESFTFLKETKISGGMEIAFKFIEEYRNSLSYNSYNLNN